MQKVLKLNKQYIAAGVAPWREIVKNIFTEAVYPLNLTFGNEDLSILEGFEVVKSWEDWYPLPIRSYDEYINTPHSRVRMPAVVVCCNYDKIAYKRALFPTKNNIWRRDNYTCLYTNRKLSKKELTVDHVTPKDLNGKDTWENLATCHKTLNHIKGNTPLGKARFPNDPKIWGQFAGQLIKLQTKPTKPKYGFNEIVFEHFREEWRHFIGEQ